MKIFINVFLVLLIASGCAPTFDNAVLYDKTHTIIESDFLKYNGYYYSISTDSTIYEERCPKPVTTIFFYKDGTAMTSGYHCNTNSIKSYFKTVKQIPDYDWGAFKINKKEISVEFYSPNSGRGRYERYQMDGYIHGDTITFTTYTGRDSKSKNITHTYYFETFNNKPDSSCSFLKKQKQFN